MTQQTTAIVPVTDREFAVKIGTKVKPVLGSTLMVLGGKLAQSMMQEIGFAAAVQKAQHGNYRAAVEIVSLAAGAAQIKVCQPEPGKLWTKASLGFFCEKVLARPTPNTKNGWSKNALKGRTMAKAILEIINGVPPTDAGDPPVTTDAATGDVLNGVPPTDAGDVLNGVAG